MILLTGAAGFIGFHVAKSLLEQNISVIGIDNLNDYYDPSLKHARLELLKKYNGFEFHKIDISDPEAIREISETYAEITHIIHLAAQAGVRYSIENPLSYGRSNLDGHLNMLELAKALQQKKLKHFVYASSSSVYGSNEKTPFSEKDRVDNPVSLYAATKRSCELLSQSYASLYQLPMSGLRFFTVYGPYGRPDMAYFSFTKAILEETPIQVFNEGKMEMYFTYIDDIVDAVCASLDKIPAGKTPHEIYNLGNNKPEQLENFITEIEAACGKKAQKTYTDMAQGDVERTYADITKAQAQLGYTPKTKISEGIPRFVDWYKSYYSG